MDNSNIKDVLNVGCDGYGDIDGSGTLFEDAIQQLKTLQDKMIVALVKHIASGFKMRSERYKKER